MGAGLPFIQGQYRSKVGTGITNVFEVDIFHPPHKLFEFVVDGKDGSEFYFIFPQSVSLFGKLFSLKLKKSDGKCFLYLVTFSLSSLCLLSVFLSV